MQITQMKFRMSEGRGECFYYVGKWHWQMLNTGGCGVCVLLHVLYACLQLLQHNGRR